MCTREWRGKVAGRETKGIAPRQWQGQTAVIIASGPSLTEEDVQKTKGQKVLAVNDNYRRAPWADVLYACDGAWWDFHYYQVRQSGFAGQLWTQDQAAAKTHQINWIRGEYSDGGVDGLSFDDTLIRLGGNSGHQAINLAVLFGASRIVLLGFDFQHTGGQVHWFGNHPKGLNNASRVALDRWKISMHKLAKDAKKAGIEIINSSRETALTCFPRMTIDEALSEVSQDGKDRNKNV